MRDARLSSPSGALPLLTEPERRTDQWAALFHPTAAISGLAAENLVYLETQMPKKLCPQGADPFLPEPFLARKCGRQIGDDLPIVQNDDTVGQADRLFHLASTPL